MATIQIDASDPPERPASQTKVLKTRGRLLTALDGLLKELPAAEITITELCRRAGISTDPLYKPHHSGFRKEIEERLKTAIAAQAVTRRERRHVLSVTAEEKIAQLEFENARLKSQLKNTQQTLNVLAQVVESLASESSRGNTLLPFPK